MSASPSIELSQVNKLINEFKFEQALQIVKDVEIKKDLNPEEILAALSYKCEIYRCIGQLDTSLKIVEELYQKSQEIKLPLYIFDALYSKGWIYYLEDNYNDFDKIVRKIKQTFIRIPREDSVDFLKREARFLLIQGMQEFNFGNLNLALDYYERAAVLFDKIDPRSRFKYVTLMGIAYAFQEKGELNKALEFDQKALSQVPDGEFFIQMSVKAAIYRSMGAIYRQKGDLDQALDYFVRDHDFLKKINPLRGNFFSIIQVLLDMKDFTQAQIYLQQYKELSEKFESELFTYGYQTARALTLKASSRMQDFFEAQIILKRLIEEKPKTSNLISANLILINLCDCYFKEFRLSNQIEVLDDIEPIIDILQNIAKTQNSYSSLANVKLLQAKLALLQINMVGARKLLTEAQKIADEHDLQLLAGEISREHDHLLEELKIWESIKKEKVSVAERLKLASIDGVMQRMQGKRAIELSDVSVEKPILLLIMDKSGINYFNHSFIGELDFDDLFSSFMSAFNTFSGEIFSSSIDRVKIADNTILINPIEPFLVCYVIKGQSYPAQQKLNRFTEIIKSTEEIWEALNRASKTSEMLELNNPPSLGNIVKEIFIN